MKRKIMILALLALVTFGTVESSFAADRDHHGRHHRSHHHHHGHDRR